MPDNTPQAAPGPGPSAAAFRRNPERAYTGPAEGTHGGLGPRTGASAAEAERFFAKLPEAIDPPMPRMARALGIGSWVIGSAACLYMVLYADFGKHEHVFSPARRAFHKYTADMFTLSKTERNMLGLDDTAAKPKPAPVATPAPAPAPAPAAPVVTVDPVVPLANEGRRWYKWW